ncbi:MAG: TetR/AcrR family transcriptional regulator [Atopobiaceae bacterium]|nr:TetR/AcrR family transcriptional regulator [Atopobiaceae bacterium]
MPPKPKFTRDQIVACALDVIRTESAEAITAQEMGKRLGTSTRPMFTYFDTVEELRQAATDAAWQIYDERARVGLSLTPAFKGFAMAYIRFAIEEPSLFRLLFMRKAEPMSLDEFLGREGHLDTILDAVEETFYIDRDQAFWLYKNMWTYAHGIAALCATEVVDFTDEEVAEKLGTVCRGLVMALHAPADERTAIVPDEGVVMPGSIDDYVRG